MGTVVIDTSQLKVSEVPWLQVLSLRASKMHASEQGLSTLLAPLGLQVPRAANALQGNPQRSCSWLEPRAWLLVSESAVQIGKQAHWLITDISDRVAVFSVKGEHARPIIAAGCDPHLMRPGTMARTRFGGIANVIVEQWAEADYRLLIDVSVAGVFAAWLKSAAQNLRSPLNLTKQAGSS
ncbi:MAG: hypothetical protein M3O62_06575 [Pseudomonadota bacterium]|nr:hypothetical protein [Pseudomonadota bacterium]